MFNNTQHSASPFRPLKSTFGPKSSAIFGVHFICALLLTIGALPRLASAQLLPPLVVLHLSPPLGTVPQGQPVTLTANVILGLTPATSGTVAFLEVNLLGSPTLSVQVGTAQVTSAGTATIILTPGTGVHSYVAVLLPSAGIPLPVVSAAVAITSLPSGGYRTSDTVTATPQGARYKLTDTTTFYGSAAPTGSITFTNGGVPVGLPVPAASLTFVPGYAAPLSTPTGAAVTSLTAVTGDFNNDGIPDLATTNFTDNTVSVLLGKGDGTFSAAKTYATGQYPYAIATGDFNNDGFQDLVVTNLLDNTVSILLNDRTGGFLGQTAFNDEPGTLIAAPYSIAAADFNGDGKLDLITTNLQTLDLSFLKGNGDGTFAAPTVAYTSSALVSPFMSVAADFDGDGIMDLALLDTNAPTAANPTTIGSVYFLKGVGDGTFTRLRTATVGKTPLALTVGDFDQTGGPDVAVVNSGSTGAAGLTVLLNPGAGIFKKETTATGAGPVSVAVVDFNNDGMADLAVANSMDTTISVFTNQGNATTKHFTAARSTVVSTIATPFQLLASDFNGDGRQDLAVIAFGATSLGMQVGIQTATVSATTTVASPMSPVSTYTSGLADSYASSSSTAPVSLARRVAKK